MTEELRAAYDRIQELEALLEEAANGLVAHCYESTPETIRRIDECLSPLVLA